jgi:hypothetical protein
MNLETQFIVFGIPLAFAIAVIRWMDFLSRVAQWRDIEKRREIFKMQRTRDVISAWRCSLLPIDFKD